MMLNIINKIKNNKGYTLLFAVIVSALVLSVGISILNISKKEFLLSSSARESTYAFYAADSGLECAVYHLTHGGDEAHGGKFSTASTDMTNVRCAGDLSAINKGGVGISSASISVLGNVTTRTSSFHLKIPNATSTCAIVNVITNYTPPSGTSPEVFSASVDSYGYNTGWDSVTQQCNVGSPNRVERALHYTR